MGQHRTGLISADLTFISTNDPHNARAEGLQGLTEGFKDASTEAGKGWLIRGGEMRMAAQVA